MGYLEDEIARVDRQIENMNIAQRTMSDKGLSLGDYDLATEMDRIEQERKMKISVG